MDAYIRWVPGQVWHRINRSRVVDMVQMRVLFFAAMVIAAVFSEETATTDPSKTFCENEEAYKTMDKKCNKPGEDEEMESIFLFMKSLSKKKKLTHDDAVTWIRRMNRLCTMLSEGTTCVAENLVEGCDNGVKKLMDFVLELENVMKKLKPKADKKDIDFKPCYTMSKSVKKLKDAAKKKGVTLEKKYDNVGESLDEDSSVSGKTVLTGIIATAIVFM